MTDKAKNVFEKEGITNVYSIDEYSVYLKPSHYKQLREKDKNEDFDSVYPFINLCMYNDIDEFEDLEDDFIYLDEENGESFSDDCDTTLSISVDISFYDFLDKHGITDDVEVEGSGSTIVCYWDKE